MKYYVKLQNWIDGPFDSRAAAEAHVRRCEFDAHKIKYEYLTEKDLGLASDESEEEE